MGEHRCQNFLHRLLESIEVRSEFLEQAHETVDLHGTGRATPGTLYEPGKDFATIFFFVGLVVAIEENSFVGGRRPLSIKGRGDFDSVQENLKRFFAMGIGYVFNMKEFIPPGKGRGKFAEGVSLNVFEVDLELNELGIFHRPKTICHRFPYEHQGLQPHLHCHWLDRR